MSHFLFVILALGTAAAASVNDKKFELPKDLLVGAGMAAVQSEGAWKEGGKSESMVDYALHSGKLQAAGFFRDPHLHDVAADSYHRYKEDVQAAAKLKLQLYRMSISWSRVLPEGDASKPNKEGVTYYHNLIDEILKYNMTPLVTMYHFDHPQIFEEKIKGWDDRRMVDKFEEFAEFLFNEYGSKVQLWTSFNEPNVYCSFFNTLIYLANGLPAESVLNKNLYPCIHNSILAHGVAQKAFRKGKHEGKVGFSVTTLLSRPATTSPEDVYASEAFNQMFTGILLNPLVHGDYPQVVKDIAGDMLPKFTDEEKEMLKDSADFIGLNL